MMGRKLKNSGMTLVEVLVSMLVLSIAAVTVISAFSMAAQVNTKAKRQQGVDSLMENMLEFAEAGGEDYASWFGGDYTDLTPGVTPVPGVTPTPQTVKIEELQNVQSGLLNYTVKITTDTAPTKYASDQLNDLKVIQFGGTQNNSILIDASDTSNDALVIQLYKSMHESAVTIHDLEEDAILAEKTEAGESYTPDYWGPALGEDGVKALINREIQLKSESTGINKFRLVGEMVYKVADSLKLPDGTSRTYTFPLCYSEEFDSDASAETSPKHLKQIYLMFKDEQTGDSEGIDIRYWDPAGMLTANFFVVKQATTPTNPTASEASASADIASTGEDKFGQYYSALDNIYIDCKVPGGSENPPKAVTIYSSLAIDPNSSICGQPNVEVKNYELVATDEEVRAVTVKIEIYDQDTGNKLAEEEVTRLQ